MMTLTKALTLYKDPNHPKWRDAQKFILDEFNSYLHTISQNCPFPQASQDRYQSCVIGLLQAAEKYDPQRKNRASFKSFAVFYIWNALREFGGMEIFFSPLSKCQYQIHRYNQICAKFMLNHGRNPTAEEAAELMDLSENTTNAVVTAKTSVPLPLDDESLFDHSDRSVDPNLSDAVQVWLEVASKNEAAIFSQYFYNGQNLSDIARSFECSREYIRQQISQIIKEIGKKWLEARSDAV